MVSSAEVGIFIGSSTAYKFVLKDSAGATIWTADPVSVPTQSTVVIPAPSAPNQVIRSTDGTNWTANDSPTLANVTVTTAATLQGTLAVTGAVTLTTKLGVAQGGTGVTLAATGGAKQLVKQISTGASFTVGTIDTSWLSDYTEWTNVAYSAGDYTASSSTWTVTSGELDFFRYKILGKTMWVQLSITGSSVGATPAELRVAIPASKTAGGVSGKTLTALYMSVTDNGSAGTGGVRVTYGNTYIALTNNAGTWAMSTTATNVNFLVSFEIQ